MTDRNFLQQVVDYESQRLGPEGWAGVTFVVPNKRSAMFVKRYVQQSVRTASFMPRILTPARLAALLTAKPEARHYDMLFTLYDCYAQLLAEHGRSSQLRDFDSFAYWGDILLSDFDDVDRALASPRKLFSNLRALHGIRADYLEPEQKEVIRTIWGDSPLTASIDRFWISMSDTPDIGSMEERFISLWEILPELYETFMARIEATGAITPGRQMRLAVERLRQMGPDEMPMKRAVVLGFSEPTVAELTIFKRLAQAKIGHFFWDISSPLLRDSDGTWNHAAPEAQRLKRLVRQLPMPADFDLASVDYTCDIEVIGVASNVMQTKVAGDILQEWVKKGVIKNDNLVDTAVVLPDERLLLPMLTALPDDIPAVNVTMGLPYRTTAFASMLKSVISMQLRARRLTGTTCFFHTDVAQVVSNPYFIHIAAEQCQTIRQWVSRSNAYNIPAEQLCNDYPVLAPVFTPVSDLKDVTEVYDYTDHLLESLQTALEKVKLPNGKDGRPVRLLELDVLSHYRKQLAELGECIKRYGVTMSQGTFFHLFERVLNNEQINLTGLPLQGLQVMGVLETRALDFSNLIILSMNERIMPRSNALRSLIPENLRMGYMLPGRSDTDSAYAYYFDRVLGRARNVKLIYDSRQDKDRAGEMSRLITRLTHSDDLPERFSVRLASVGMPMIASAARSIQIEKTPEVMQRLQGFRPGGHLRFSAAALKSLKRCGLQFYLQYVNNLRGENEVTDYIDDATYGTIVHATAQVLYSALHGRPVTTDVIGGMLVGDYLRDTIKQVVIEKNYGTDSPATRNLPQEAQLVIDVMERYIRQMLIEEQQAFCTPSFEFVGAEVPGAQPVWDLGDGMKVNFTMSIDRIDRVAPDHLRFIDYKTGSDLTNATSIDQLFAPGHSHDALLQLMIYCHAYAAMTGFDGKITPYVYSIRQLLGVGRNTSVEIMSPITIGNKPVDDYREYTSEFMPQLTELVASVFDENKPFTQAANESNCTFCPFVTMCGRKPRKK